MLGKYLSVFWGKWKGPEALKPGCRMDWDGGMDHSQFPQ